MAVALAQTIKVWCDEMGLVRLGLYDAEGKLFAGAAMTSDLALQVMDKWMEACDQAVALSTSAGSA